MPMPNHDTHEQRTDSEICVLDLIDGILNSLKRLDAVAEMVCAAAAGNDELESDAVAELMYFARADIESINLSVHVLHDRVRGTDQSRAGSSA